MFENGQAKLDFEAQAMRARHPLFTEVLPMDSIQS